MRSEPSAAREVLIRLLLVAVSSAAALLLAEGALRLRASLGGSLEEQLERSGNTELGAAARSSFSLRGLVRASSLPGVVYELKPSLQGSFRGRLVETSSQGLRDREYSLAKPAATFRIAGLGDSVMFGWGVGQDEPYTEVLERRANAAGGSGRFEVLNFAVPGYNTAMEVALFEHKALAFAPDLVILHFVDNDLRLPHFMEARSEDARSWRRSYLLELVVSRLRAAAGEDGLPDHGLDRLSPGERRVVRSRYRHLAGESGFRRAVERLAQLARERSIPVVVLRLSARHEHQTLVDEAVGEYGFHTVEASDHFGRHLGSLGLPPSDESWGKTFWVSRRDHHPNALGHELYAEALWEAFGKIDEVGSFFEAGIRPR